MELAEQERAAAKAPPSWTQLEVIPAPHISQHAADDEVYEADTGEVAFVPLPAGVETGMGVETEDLFDFEDSVKPIIQVCSPCKTHLFCLLTTLPFPPRC